MARSGIDFLCIGAPRSGTTWLFEMLRAHPGVFMPPVKELRHFFSTRSSDARQRLAAELLARTASLTEDDEAFLQRWATYDGHSDSAYLELFDLPGPAAANRRVGEMSPVYCIASREEIRRIHATVGPDCRILFLIRDPIDRDLSHLGLRHANGHEVHDLAEARRVLSGPRFRNRSRYARTIRLWRAQFGDASVYIEFYERIQQDPQGVLQRICNFLGIAYDPALFPAGLVQRQVNSSRELWERFPFADALRRELAQAHLNTINQVCHLFPSAAEPRQWRRRALALIGAAPAAPAAGSPDTTALVNTVPAASRPKVFGIGFHKTGTTSLAQALRILGYRVTGPNGTRNPDIANNVQRLVQRLVPQYDAFQDNPWPVLYRELDRRFPNSKFILTIRPTDAWIDSQLRHFGDRQTPMRRWIYGAGCPKGNEERYMARYEKHNREVREYFAGRPDDLLVMDLPAGDGWEKLCPFLGLPAPDCPFPHANSQEERQTLRRA